MQRLTIIFEGRDRDVREPTDAWQDEYDACKGSGRFRVGLANLDEMLAQPALPADVIEEELLPAILRCHTMDETAYRHLSRALAARGYRLLTSCGRAFWFFFGTGSDLPAEHYEIPSALPGVASFGSEGVAGKRKASSYLVRDLDGPLAWDEGQVVHGKVSVARSLELAARYAEAKGPNCTGHVCFQETIAPARYHGALVGWRIFYFGMKPFYRAALSDLGLYSEDYPEVPPEVVGAFQYVSMSPFYAADLVLSAEGKWRCTRLFDGQMTPLPAGGLAAEFYGALVRAWEDFLR